MIGGLVKPLVTVLYSIPAILSLVFISGYQNRLPPWMLDKSLLFTGCLFAAGLGFAILVVKTPLFRKNNLLYSLIRTIVVGALVCMPILCLLLILSLGMERYSMANSQLLAFLVLYFVLLVINSLPLRAIILLLINICVLFYTLLPSITENARVSLQDLVSGKTKLYDDSKSYIYTSLYDLEVTDHVIIPNPNRDIGGGGGLSVIDKSRLILVTADGKVRLLNIENDQIRMRPEILKTPFNNNAYKKSAKNPSKYFRVTDSLVEKTLSGEYRMFISYHHWDANNDCITLKVAEADIDIESFGKSSVNWVERFTSEPCIKQAIHNTNGGRMALLGEHTLLLTIGGTKSTAWSDELLAKISYGKIFAIDKQNWKSRVYSSGHRNPQGLLIMEDGTIWSTEHGPHGGDELNLIYEGADYGWPYASYGTDYGKKIFSRGDTPGQHNIGQRPIYAWVPSIGISNLISIKGTAFPLWREDLMVSSLHGLSHGKSLFRVKIVEGRVVVVERIKTGRPIRDLVELVDGQLALWNGRNVIQLVKPSRIAFSVCSGCHAVRREIHGIGPDLMGVVNKSVARNNGYQYSKSMKNFGGKWTRDRLDKFLENPAATVPGTTMNFPGIEHYEERKEIIDYLENIRLPEGGS